MDEFSRKPNDSRASGFSAGGHPDHGHLDDDTLNAYLDGGLDAAERARADAHIRGCARCQLVLGQLRVTVDLLRSLPEPRVPRSFRLGEEHRRAPERAPAVRSLPGGASTPPGNVVSLWPRLRVVASIAAVLVLVLVGGALLTSQGDDGDSAEQVAFVATETPAPTPTTLPATTGETPVPSQASEGADGEFGESDAVFRNDDAAVPGAPADDEEIDATGGVAGNESNLLEREGSVEAPGRESAMPGTSMSAMPVELAPTSAPLPPPPPVTDAPDSDARAPAAPLGSSANGTGWALALVVVVPLAAGAIAIRARSGARRSDLS